MIDPAGYRDRFPILSTCTYLINHSLAAMPAAAEERVLEYTRMWRERGIRSWGEGWWDMSWTVGDQLGRILGAPPEYPFIVSMDAAASELGYRPVATYPEAVRETCAWLVGELEAGRDWNGTYLEGMLDYAAEDAAIAAVA